MSQSPQVNLTLLDGKSVVSQDENLAAGATVKASVSYSLRSLERYFYPDAPVHHHVHHGHEHSPTVASNPVWATLYVDGKADGSFEISTSAGASQLESATLNLSNGVHVVEVGFSTSAVSAGASLPVGGLTTEPVVYTEGNTLQLYLGDVEISPLGKGSSSGAIITAQDEKSGFKINGTLDGSRTVLASIKTLTVEILSPAGAIVGKEIIDIGSPNSNGGAFTIEHGGRLNGSAASFSVNFGPNLPFPSTGAGYQIVVIASDGVHSADLVTSAEAYCFCEGVHIATPDGERAVETLKSGDLVRLADGRSLPVRWVGTQAVSMMFADPLRLQPIRIRAGALEENVPMRDLLVSPDHAVFVGGVLVQAGALVNGETVVRDASSPVRFTYYHLELEEHALVIADGAPCERFIDNVDRMAFDNWGEHEALGLEDQPLIEMVYPRAKSARQVPSSVRRQLAARVEALRGQWAKSAA